MDRYRYEWVRGTYVIRWGSNPVLTPRGNPFSTIYERLAALVCEDMRQYGPGPLDSLSYVTLHASYTDFGSTVAKSELIRSILADYVLDWDVALAQLSAFNSFGSWPSIGYDSAKSGRILDPSIYFGPPEEPSVIQAWLEGLSLRAICSLLVCRAAFHSVHVGYRFLHPHSPVPASHLVQGILGVSDVIHPSLSVEDDPEETESRIVTFLEKIKFYVSFPDEKIS